MDTGEQERADESFVFTDAALVLWMMVRKVNRCDKAVCADVHGENCACGSEFRRELYAIERGEHVRENITPESGD